MGRTLVTLDAGSDALAIELAPSLRQADIDEVRDGWGLSGLDALLMSVRSSTISIGMRFDGRLGALFGVAPVAPEPLLGLASLGCLWFLTGTACDEHKLSLVRAAKRLVPALHDFSRCIELRNWLDARYSGALALAQLVGFRVLETRPQGPAGLPFHLVARRA